MDRGPVQTTLGKSGELLECQVGKQNRMGVVRQFAVALGLNILAARRVLEICIRIAFDDTPIEDLTPADGREEVEVHDENSAFRGHPGRS